MKKFNFKQISAVMASVMLGITGIAGAMAAAYPQPMVVGTTGDFAVVYGSDAATSDQTQATSIANQLQAMVSGSAVVGSDSVQIRKSTDEFNLADNLNSFYVTIDSDELEDVLADGVYKNDGNDEFDYEQEIVLGSMTLEHFTDNDFNNDEPVIGFNIAGGTTILNYTLDFTPDNADSDSDDWNEFEGTTIEILGKEYYILSASNASSPSLELLDSANSATLTGDDDTITLEAGGTSYQVSITYIDDDEVKLTINGETTPSLNEDDTYKLDSGDYIGIKEIGFQAISGGDEFVEFSIGSGKIELTEGEEVEINGDDISDMDEYEGYALNAYVTQDSGNSNRLDTFTIEWKTDNGNSGDTWLAFDTDSKELTMPVFNNLKLTLGNFVTDAEEVTSIDPDGDDSFTLDTTVTDGDVSLNLLYANSTGTGFAGIGESATQQLVTNSTADSTISWNENSSYFVATWINSDDHESYVLEVSDIDDTDSDKNTTTIKSIASGSSKAIDLDIGETDEIGQISFYLNASNEEEETATIVLDVAGSASGEVTADKIVTAEGLKIQLPQDEDDATAGGINLTVGEATQTAWLMNFTEETESGNIDEGDSFNITLGFNDDETSVSSVSVTDYETTDSSDDYIGYVASDLATMTMFYTGDEQDNIDITYHGTEAYAEVFLSSTDITTGTSELGNVLVTDAQVSAVQGRNLIVVGGSAVNEVAAELVGVNYPTYSDAWTAATGVGSGQLLIQSFNNPYQTGKVAVLVAGYEAADTIAGAARLINQPSTIDTTAGNKYVYQTGTEGASTLVSGP